MFINMWGVNQSFHHCIWTNLNLNFKFAQIIINMLIDRLLKDEISQLATFFLSTQVIYDGEVELKTKENGIYNFRNLKEL